MLILIPFLALVFLIVDASWCLFVKATLQFAVQSAVNSAASDTANGLVSLTQGWVSTQSLGLISAASAPSEVVVNFYQPATADMSSPMTSATAGANATGNIVQVTVNYTFLPLAPLLRSGAAIPLTASASAVITASPPPTM